MNFGIQLLHYSWAPFFFIMCDFSDVLCSKAWAVSTFHGRRQKLHNYRKVIPALKSARKPPTLQL